MASPKSPVAAQEPKSDSPGGPAMDEETRRKTTEAVQSVAAEIGNIMAEMNALKAQMADQLGGMDDGTNGLRGELDKIKSQIAAGTGGGLQSELDSLAGGGQGRARSRGSASGSSTTGGGPSSLQRGSRRFDQRSAREEDQARQRQDAREQRKKDSMSSVSNVTYLIIFLVVCLGLWRVYNMSRQVYEDDYEGYPSPDDLF